MIDYNYDNIEKNNDNADIEKNNDDDDIEKIIDDADNDNDNDKNEDNLRPQLWLRRPHFLSQFSPPSPIACSF